MLKIKVGTALLHSTHSNKVASQGMSEAKVEKIKEAAHKILVR